MKVYGYARISTKEHALDHQLVELQKYVEDRFIFTNKASGKDMDRLSSTYKSLSMNTDRVEYQLLKKESQRGDTIYIKSLDRLGRRKYLIKKELEYFMEKGVRIKILDIPTSMMEIPKEEDWILDMINNLVIELLSSLAEQERTAFSERQAEGIAKAKGKGVHIGSVGAHFT